MFLTDPVRGVHRSIEPYDGATRPGATARRERDAGTRTGADGR